jgi:hypothetical protein
MVCVISATPPCAAATRALSTRLVTRLVTPLSLKCGDKNKDKSSAECEALASALHDHGKISFTRQELDSFNLPPLSYTLSMSEALKGSYIRAAGKCYRPAQNRLELTGRKLTAAGYRELAVFLVCNSPAKKLSLQFRMLRNAIRNQRLSPKISAFLMPATHCITISYT